MTKADLVNSVAEEFELTRRQVTEVVDMVFSEITGALRKGDKVALVPFGSFVVRQRKKREGRNPKTGEKLMIAARKVPAFQAGKALREAVGGAKNGAKSSGAKKSVGKKAGSKR